LLRVAVLVAGTQTQPEVVVVVPEVIAQAQRNPLPLVRHIQ
jgi:hypothetical protein